MKKINRNNLNSKKVKRNPISVFIMALIFILTLASVFLVVEVAALGAKMTDIERSKEELLRENSSLETNLANGLSLTNLAKKAKELGFEGPKTVVYIKSPEGVARLPE